MQTFLFQELIFSTVCLLQCSISNIRIRFLISILIVRPLMFISEYVQQLFFAKNLIVLLFYTTSVCILFIQLLLQVHIVYLYQRLVRNRWVSILHPILSCKQAQLIV